MFSLLLITNFYLANTTELSSAAILIRNIRQLFLLFLGICSHKPLQDVLGNSMFLIFFAAAGLDVILIINQQKE